MYLHDAQLANIVTSFATCLAGIMPMIWCVLIGRQPFRWFFVYLCILITGIPTVWWHSSEVSLTAAAFDIASNILLAWALQVAVSGDFMQPRGRRTLLAVSTVVNLCAWAWLLYEVLSGNKVPLLQFGAFGRFYTGEVVLILNAWVVVILFVVYWRMVPVKARPLMGLVIAVFFIGMLLATADGDQIGLRILPWHALWHIVGAFGFVTLFLFNHVRFTEAPDIGAGR